MKWLRRFLRIGYCDRNLIIFTFFLLASVRLGLLFLQFRTLLKITTKISQYTSAPEVITKFSVGKIARCVEKVSWFMPGVKCLARGLTTQVLMSRYGYNPELRIGVAKGDNGKLEAHAWVEYQGKIVIGNLPDLARFVPMGSFKEAKSKI